jgi:hypothetical protein
VDIALLSPEGNSKSLLSSRSQDIVICEKIIEGIETSYSDENKDEAVELIEPPADNDIYIEIEIAQILSDKTTHLRVITILWSQSGETSHLHDKYEEQ